MNILTSPRLAFSLIIAIAVYSATVTMTGLEHPFTHPLFLGLVTALFCCTTACTIRKVLAIRRMSVTVDDLYPILTDISSEQLHACLVNTGFMRKGALYSKASPMLWGGVLLHIGILTVMAGALANQALSDAGGFEVAEGGQVFLAAPGTVLGRSQGVLVKGAPPQYTIALERFDPYLHQQGYAPDRASRLKIELPDGTTKTALVDRAQGISVGDTTIYQAVPFGYALRVSMEGREFAIHLRTTAPKRAEATVTDPGGVPVVFFLVSENNLEELRGTAAVRIGVSRHGGFMWLQPKELFPFGNGSARIESLVRWGGFTYARNPGVAVVFSGFFVLLLGCGMLLVPCGLASIEENADGTGRLLLCAPRWGIYFRRRFEEILLTHSHEEINR